ncbi:MAG: hypothetical protein ACTSRP_22315 [Candidatus Helarchaeota archaeon]
MTKLNLNYIWIKDVNYKNIKEDIIYSYHIKDMKIIQKVIDNLKKKKLGKKVSEDDLNPKNPSFIKWINLIFENLDRLEKIENTIEDIINEFRSFLRTRSKELGKYIVGLLVLNYSIIIFHCKKIESIAQVDQIIKGVDRLLDPQNVYRAIVIEKTDRCNYYYFFEHNHKLSRALANIFGIDYELIGFDILGTFKLVLNLENTNSPFKFLLPLNLEDFDLLFENNEITRDGQFKLGNLKAKIDFVKIYGEKSIKFMEFYEKYILWRQNLNTHKRKFYNLIIPNSKIPYFFEHNKIKINNKFKYYEDANFVYKYLLNGQQKIYEKNHNKFTILFSTYCPPGIKPSDSLIHKIKNAIFDKIEQLEIWHAGLKLLKTEPIYFGNLVIYNNFPQLKNNITKIKLINSLIQNSTKYIDIRIKLLNQILISFMIQKIFENTHLEIIFTHIYEELLSELEFEFQNNNFKLTEHEDNLIEYKSASDYLKYKNPINFAESRLIPTIKNKGIPKIIIYGIEDDGSIQPIYNLKSDMLAKIEDSVSQHYNNLNCRCIDIKVESGRIFLVIYFEK